MSPPDPAKMPMADGGRDWLAFGVAVYGALVATGVAAYQSVRDRPGVKLMITPYSRLLNENDRWAVWAVRVVNHRKRPITIINAGVITDGKTRLKSSFIDINGQPSPSPFPSELADGASIEVFVQRVGKAATVRGVWASDALNRRFQARYPSRNPIHRYHAWQDRRRFDTARAQAGRKQIE